MQNHINSDLRCLCRWLRVNKISLNKSKTELLIFKHPNKTINHEFKFKMDGKKLYPSKFVKYLGILIDSNLTFSYHMNSISSKLSRAIGLLSRILHYVTKGIIRSIYFAIFSSILTYASQIWGQIKSRHFTRLVTLQNKAIKIINFANFRDPVMPLYKAMKILKLSDNIRINNYLFVFDDLSGCLPPALKNAFQLSASLHSYVTRNSTHKMVKLPKARTTVYGLKSIKFQACHEWNFFNKHFKDKQLHAKSKLVCKKTLNNYFYESY